MTNEALLVAACKAVAKFYREQGTTKNDIQFEEAILKSLLHDTELLAKGELFLEKKTQYDDCSTGFKRMYKLLDRIEISRFPNSWIRINLAIEDVVLVVNMKISGVQPLPLLKQSQLPQED